MILTAGIDDNDRRLDRILRKALPDMPLSALHRLLRQGQIRVNGSPAKGNDRIFAGAHIEVMQIAETAARPPSSRSFTKRSFIKHSASRSIDIAILWEGSGLLVLDKPAGLVVHGSPDSLESRVQACFSGKLPASLSFKPGPLHRLDKPTSGIVVFGINLEAARRFSSLLAQGKIAKRYLAILEGKITKDEVWEETLFRDKTIQKTIVRPAGPSGEQAAGQRALTRVIPLAWAKYKGSDFTYARLEIETGRTHQIRAQAAAHKHPLAGDRKYGGKPLFFSGSPVNGCYLNSFYLHAAELELPPLIKAPLPKNFSQLVKELFG